MPLERQLARVHALRVPSGSTHFAEAIGLHRAGKLVRVLPGVFVLAGTQGRARTRAAAVCAYDPRAVLTGEAATALHVRLGMWPQAIGFVSPRRWTVRPDWVRPRIGSLPPEHVRLRPLPHAALAVAVLQLATERGTPDCVDDALRRRRVTPAELAAAVEALSGTVGNPQRRAIVADSIQRPWSAGERQLHRVLRAAGLTGWRGNVAVMACGNKYFIDVAFWEEKVAVELDGRTVHGADTFEEDRLRHNDLVAAGWRVLRVTPTMVREDPRRVVDRVRRTLAYARPRTNPQ